MTWFYDRLRSEGDMLVLPGAFDALSARLIARAGHEAVYCGGFASTAAQFALPDLGLLSLTEIVEIYRRIKRANPDTPLIVDGDAGHGGLLNVERMVAAFAGVGVDAFHIEDQVMPKR
ncbi:MAG: isocitrate lyase/PEP mutase family protein, partial [Pseudomonadota bacterium]